MRDFEGKYRFPMLSAKSANKLRKIAGPLALDHPDTALKILIECLHKSRKSEGVEKVLKETKQSLVQNFL